VFFQGRLVTLCDDNSLHLWELNEEESAAGGEDGASGEWALEEVKEVALEGKLKRISACCLERSGDHLLIGTEGGNIYLLDLKSFEMTEQIIYQDVVLQKFVSLDLNVY
jgi:lethal(2) giant larvae protein